MIRLKICIKVAGEMASAVAWRLYMAHCAGSSCWSRQSRWP